MGYGARFGVGGHGRVPVHRGDWRILGIREGLRLGVKLAVGLWKRWSQPSDLRFLSCCSWVGELHQIYDKVSLLILIIDYMTNLITY